MMYSPESTLIVYRELSKALDGLLSTVTHFEDQDNNLLKVDIDFDPQLFTKSERLQLLRYNASLQYSIERLSSIVELVPFNFRKTKTTDPSFEDK